MANSITSTQRVALLKTLQDRFVASMPYHMQTSWQSVDQAIQNAPHSLETLFAMESTGGEPNVVEDPASPTAIVFMDCSAETPAGRRSLCYDQAALLSRKAHPPAGNAVDTAADMGIELLSETQYRGLQRLGEFDLKTSSWVLTPPEVRRLGGALFCDRRYGRVFVYHNGADAYYGSRGFRGCLVLPLPL